MSKSLSTYKDKTGSIKLEYLSGELHSIEILTNCDLIAWDALRYEITYLETDLSSTFKKLRTNAVKEKIALFCEAYKAWSLHKTGTELAYKVSRADSGMVKNINVNQELLRVFFLTDFWTKEKTISNYVKHYNEIQRIAATKGAESGTGQFNKMGESLQKWFG